MHPATTEAGVQVLVKREDLNHPFVSGNKWWKLKYNVAAAWSANLTTLLTFGGAFSNHIYATAAAANQLQLRAIGVIRGEVSLPLNDTLLFARDQGMLLHHVTRDEYRKKSDSVFIETLKEKFGNFCLIPEGASNLLAVKGCAEFASSQLADIESDFICLPVGTGGTMAGILCGCKSTQRLVGVPVLKNADFLKSEIENYSESFSGRRHNNWSLLTAYHHGGYAKVTADLLAFVKEMKSLYNLPLDHVYTGKLVFAVFKEIESHSFPRGSTILLVHTGGLQGKYT